VAVVIPRQSIAILWAQGRSIANYHGRARGGRRFPFTLVFGLVWYGMWAFIALSVMRVAADPNDLALIQRAGPSSLLLIFAYWQVIPIIMVSTGLSLDLNRLVVYPIPHTQLFTIEVMLRITTCLEMLLVLLGLMAGLWRNPLVPLWAPLAVAVFGAFNLFLSTAIRDLLGRLLSRKGFREVMIFGLVLLAALPQAFMVSGPPERLRSLVEPTLGAASPWGSTSRLMTGSMDLFALAMLAVWTTLAWMLGRSQFERSLHFDAAAARSAERVTGGRLQLLERVLRLPGILFKDPLAALIEKEVRFLSRSARFRLLFLMGFSFGLIIWLPLAMRGDPESVFRTNYLTIVSAYALMLLGEICFWNNFGMDRSAAQTYFVMPLELHTVLIAKNIAATFFIFLEITLIAVFCAILRMPITAASVGEAAATTVVLTIFMMAIGNMISTRYPRPVDPAQSWRSGAMGRVQAYLLFLYPVASAPIFLAYGARYAFETEYAFYAVLLMDFLIGMVVYASALQSSTQAAHERKEDMIMALSSSQGPVGS
jgi:ABC-2 type transport system permease protein